MALTCAGLNNPIQESAPTLPEYTFTNELSGEISFLLPKAGLRFSAFTRYNDRLVRYFLTLNETGEAITGQRVQKGFIITDVSTSKTLWKKRIQLGAGIRNLFNVRNVTVSGGGSVGHSDSGSTSPVAIGRVYFAKMSWTFSKQ